MTTLTTPEPARPQPLTDVARDALRVQGTWVGVARCSGSSLGRSRCGVTNGAPLVTPVANPRDNAGHPLVALPPTQPLPPPLMPPGTFGLPNLG